MPCCKKGKKRLALLEVGFFSPRPLRHHKIHASPPLIFFPLSSISYSAAIHPLFFLSLEDGVRKVSLQYFKSLAKGKK